jgi:hypothetical protein
VNPESLKQKDVCSECHAEWIEEEYTCCSCYGTGEDDDPLSFHGCLSCQGKGKISTWKCECDPYGEEE